MTKTAVAPQAGLIPAGQMAKLLMVTSQWLRQLSARDYIPKAVKGQYQLIPTVQGYIRFLKDEERRTSKVQADSGLKAARQREIEIRTARDEGRLVEMEDVELVVSSVFATLRSELSGIPASVTRDVSLREKIEKGLNGAFARSQGRFQEASAAIRSGGDPLGAIGETDG